MSNEPGRPDSKQDTTGNAASRPRRILLIDSDAASADSGKRLLEELGYSVIICDSPTNALVLIHTPSEHFDCVIADLAMPAISGLELANTNRLCRPKTPFVLACGSSTALSTDFLRNSGVTAFIVKPFSVESLTAILHSALGGKASL